MITVQERERIRRAYFLEDKSIREICSELHHSTETIRSALRDAVAPSPVVRQRASPVLGPYHARIDELLSASEQLPRKQRYTSDSIYRQLYTEGYRGSESGLRRYIGRWRREQKKRTVYLPLEFDAGQDAQVDWGEALFLLEEQETRAHLFVMRLCYSRRLFAMAFPFEKQEAFFLGHVHAFHHFGGVPHRISYDNLKSAVHILKGRNRKEQDTFTAFRSHHLFESHFCTPGQAYEKGGIESDVGLVQRRLMVPLPQVSSWHQLNAHLLAGCQREDERSVPNQSVRVLEAWHQEKSHLLPLPEYDWECCVTRCVKLNGYSQVQFETNHYSVPVEEAYPNLVLKAYPFELHILHQDRILTRHARCFGKHQEVLEPLHYLALLEQRPGAFEHAKPIRRWRERWPLVYEQLLTHLRQRFEGRQATREFVRILKLHQEFPQEHVQRAIQQALEYGCVHEEGIRLCLKQNATPDARVSALDLEHHCQPAIAELAHIGRQPCDLTPYDQLLQQLACQPTTAQEGDTPEGEAHV